jgi:hypothetical protein
VECTIKILIKSKSNNLIISGLVEEGYHSSNPYHNAVHAADVAQAMHCYLKEGKVTQQFSTVAIQIFDRTSPEHVAR